MKAIFMMILAGFFLFGCAQPNSADLEARVAVLEVATETNLVNITTVNDNTYYLQDLIMQLAEWLYEIDEIVVKRDQTEVKSDEKDKI